MNMLDRLQEDMKDAMRKKEKERLTVIRSLKSALQNEAIHQGHVLSEEEELTVLSREMKQRNESLHEFIQAERTDLADKTRREIAVIEFYLPSKLSNEELDAIVEETIAETGAVSKADMGKVMSAIMPKVKGRADGSEVKKRVEYALA